METKTTQNQIIITMSSDEKTKLPESADFLVASAIAGMTIIFGLSGA